MSGETEAQISALTVDVLAQHLRELREYDHRIQEERDRRYAEVALEREKAVTIKEKADLAAIQLAREIQTYKDEKANELRSQIESERGTYATQADLRAMDDKWDARLKPIADYIASEQGRRGGIGVSTGVLVASLTALATVMGIIVVVTNLIASN